MDDFRRELSHLLNRHSMESASNTPDWILASFLVKCLEAYDDTVQARAGWYGRMDVPAAGSIPYQQLAIGCPQQEDN